MELWEVPTSRFVEHFNAVGIVEVECDMGTFQGDYRSPLQVIESYNAKSVGPLATMAWD
jgi:hypothetical protein